MNNKLISGHVYSKRIHKHITFLDILETNRVVLRQLVIKKDLLKQIINRINLGSHLICKVRYEGEEENSLEEIVSIVSVKSNKLLYYSPKNSENWNLSTRSIYPWFAFRTISNRQLLIFRSELKNYWRNYMNSKGFMEIDTPILTMPSEEGSRNFLVPYRLNTNEFFALAQSPQLYKQILAYSGINYYQIAPVFRDEDSRRDRANGEFYQLDVEMEASRLERVIDFCVDLIEETLRYFEVSFVNMGSIGYQECIEIYGSDKPRKEPQKNYTYKGKWGTDDPLQIWTIVDFPLTEVDEKGNSTYLNNPFTKIRKGSNKGEQFDIVLSGTEIVSGGLRETDPEIFTSFLKLINVKEDFNFLTRGMRSGIYQHGGFGLGLERFLVILQNKVSDRGRIWSVNEMIPFPLNDKKRNRLMGFPKRIEMED